MPTPEFTDAEIAKVKAKYPSLNLVSPGSLEGALDIFAQFDGKDIRDSFEVRITAINPHSSRIPALYEIGGRIQAIAKKHGIADLRDLHRNPDGTSCLCVKQLEKQKYPPGSDLFTFVEDIGIPYLYWLSHYDAQGKGPWGDYSHGGLGLLEFYSDGGEQMIEDIEEVAKNVVAEGNWKEYSRQLRKPSAERSCLCGSGKPFHKCHPRAWRGVEHLHAELRRLKLNAYKLYRRDTAKK